MISTKLSRNAVAANLMIQFTDRIMHPVLQKFYLNCKDEGVLVRRASTLQDIQMNFYLVEIQEKAEIGQIHLKNVPHDFIFITTVFYLISEQEEQNLTQIPPTQRTLLLRQGLDLKFYADYQLQNTQSEQQSLRFLCDMSAAIINSKFQKQIGFYDQSTSEIKGQAQNQHQKLWINILYQIPGLGQEKCLAIALKYPNYKTLLSDYQGPRQLPALLVRRGLKEVRLGQSMANRVYKALFSSNYQQNILDRKY